MSSTRTHKRKVQNEKKRIPCMLEAISEKPAVSTQETEASQLDDVPDTSQNEDSKLSLREKLRNWYIEYNPSVECCSSLLKILKSESAVLIPLLN